MQSAKAGETVRILTNQTPFYGECGGQVGDHGRACIVQGGRQRSIDTEKKLGALHVHVVEVTGEFAVGDAVDFTSIARSAAPPAPTTRRRIFCTPR